MGKKVLIKTITIFGANGHMGTNVAALFASFGHCKVFMISRQKESAVQACSKCVSLVRSDSIFPNLVPSSYDQAEECIRQSDLIYESTSENLDVKKQVFLTIAKYVSDKQIIATGTSGLSIDLLSSFLPEKIQPNLVGIHFFNPTYGMPLCELIPSQKTDKDLLPFLFDYLSKTLFRSVVLCKNKPGFLANRIGFMVINSALAEAEKYKDLGGIAYIDSLMGCFTGKNMRPIQTADYVGLDVTTAIVDNIFANSADDFMKEHFIVPYYVRSLIENHCLGDKSGGGFYKTMGNESGVPQSFVYDIATNDYVPSSLYCSPFLQKLLDYLEVGKNGLYKEALLSNGEQEGFLIRKYIAEYFSYSLFAAKEVTGNINSADEAMQYGFSWMPPLAYLDLFGGKEAMAKMISETFVNEKEKQVALSLLREAPDSSKYPFAKFLKARI